MAPRPNSLHAALQRVIVLNGTATTTPVNVNPYVNLATRSTSTSTSSSTAGHNSTGPSEPIVLVGVPLVDASGTVQITSAPAGGSRPWQEEEVADAQRAQQFQREWLRELEAAANARWREWLGG